MDADKKALGDSNLAADEYTPRQRRIMDTRLAKSLADIKAGRVRGPFNSAKEMIADMKSQMKKRASAKRAKRSG